MKPGFNRDTKALVRRMYWGGNGDGGKGWSTGMVVRGISWVGT